jgi:protein TonB
MNRLAVRPLVAATASLVLHLALGALILTAHGWTPERMPVLVAELLEAEALVPAPQPPAAVARLPVRERRPITPPKPIVAPAPPVESAKPEPEPPRAVAPPPPEPRAASATSEPEPEPATALAPPVLAAPVAAAPREPEPPEPVARRHPAEAATQVWSIEPSPSAPGPDVGIALGPPLSGPPVSAPPSPEPGAFAGPAPAAGPPASAPSPSAVGDAVAAVPPGGITRHALPRGGYQYRPAYPPTARRLGAQGTTLLYVLVGDTGRVLDVVVKQSAGHPDLDQAAADAVRRWRFEPARRGHEPVEMWVQLPVEFRLR